MSIPPVDAPARMTMPMPAPIIIPPRIVQSIASFVREDSAGNCCQNASKIGYKNVDKSVVAANFQPSTKSPSKKVRTLKHSTNAVIGVWNQCADARARPVVPPVMMPDGRIKATTARDYRAFPNRIRKIRNRFFNIWCSLGDMAVSFFHCDNTVKRQKKRDM